MADETKRRLRIAVVGVDERARNALQLFFEGPCRNCCELADPDSADINLVDLDAYQAPQIKSDMDRRFPTRPSIVMSLLDKSGEGEFFVHKPLNSQRLLGVLNQVRETLGPRLRDVEAPPGVTPSAHRPAPPQAAQSPRREAASAAAQVSSHAPAEVPPRDSAAAPAETPPRPRPARPPPLESEASGAGSSRSVPEAPYSTVRAAMCMDETSARTFIGTAPDVDPSDPQQVAKACYDPAQYFQGWLQDACREAERTRRVIQLAVFKRSFSILPDTREVQHSLSDSRLRSVCIVPLAEGDVEKNELGWAPRPREGMVHRELLDAFLWKVALWTSRGRVPLGTDIERPVYLRHWPNMTRLVVPLHGLRVASLWAKHATSPLLGAQQLGIPQRYVFAFYSAAFAIGLSGQSKRNVDTLIEPEPPKEPKHRGLLKRILNRLRGHEAVAAGQGEHRE